MHPYNKELAVCETLESVIAGDRLFVGNVTDDAAAIGALLSVGSRVSVLGAGCGSALRILAALGLRPVGIDSDEDVLGVLRALLQRYFRPAPHELALETADAKRYLVSRPMQAEGAIVDLYTPLAYSEVVFQASFWALVREHVGETGWALVNVWGLPHHIDPDAAEGALPHILGAASASWNSATIAPFRRNTSLLLGGVPKDLEVAFSQGASAEPSHLSEFDLAAATVVRQRLAMGRRVATADFAHLETIGPISKAGINRLLADRWDEAMAPILRLAGMSDQSELLTSRDKAWDSTLEMAERGLAGQSLLPDIAAARAYDRDGSMEWFGENVVDNWDELRVHHPSWLRRFALPQAMAYAACPFVKTPPWKGALAECVRAELRESGPSSPQGFTSDGVSAEIRESS